MSAHNTWFDDETFWEATFDSMFPAERLEAAEREVDGLMELTGQTDGPVLDLACGPGRHSVRFAQLGFDVTGVDLSPFLLAKARNHAEDQGVGVEWVESDMRDFLRPNTYALAVNLFTAFGYFREHEENMRVLRNVHESLLPGGTFVIDVAGKEILARIFQPTGSSEIPGTLIIQRRNVTDDWSRMENVWIAIQGEKIRSYRVDHWIYSARELKLMMGEVGFGEVAAYGDFYGAPYGTGAARLVVVGKKQSGNRPDVSRCSRPL